MTSLVLIENRRCVLIHLGEALRSDRLALVLSLIAIKLVNPNRENNQINHFVNPYQKLIVNPSKTR